jgi:hypothetical protein
MAEFGDLILGLLDLAAVHTVVETGAEFGGMTQPLADFCARRNGELITIDPAPAPEFVTWVQNQPQVRHIAAPSLEVMGDLADIDAWVIDGDHNYFTVYHELILADALSRRDGRPLLALLHDVGWPCSRRDMYYAPERIPPEFRQPYSFDAGVLLDSADAQAHRGFRGMGQFAFALQAGGARNGVLTAVEDFCRVAETGTRRLLYAHIPAVFGLGVLFDAGAPWAQSVAEAVIPYHENPLLAKLEANRLRNYLTVLDWQDGYISRPQGNAEGTRPPASLLTGPF